MLLGESKTKTKVVVVRAAWRSAATARQAAAYGVTVPATTTAHAAGAKIEATVSIPVIYHQYYWQLGYDTIKAQGYKQKNLDNCLSYINRGADIGRLIRQTFQVGNRYLTKDIKASLQKIYDDLGIKKCAKGSDLKDYFQIKPIKDAHGNNGFELHP